MFMQVIEGRVTDPDRFRQQYDRWEAELRPGAPGFLGGTWGLTPDGRGVTIASFDTAEHAHANNDRAEQGRWWAETEQAYDGVEFHDCEDVDVLFDGVPDHAGFVQVIEGRARDETEAREVFGSSDGQLRESRPDILGGLVGWHGDGGFTQVVYFRSGRTPGGASPTAATTSWTSGTGR
jgi:hypothetical protein